MAIKPDKTRIIATIPKDLKLILDKLCEEDKRNISQEIEYIIEKYINDYGHLYKSL